MLSLGGQGETVELWLAQGEETLVSCQGSIQIDSSGKFRTGELPVHAPCLDWSRFSRSRREAHTASCQTMQAVHWGQF